MQEKQQNNNSKRKNRKTECRKLNVENRMPKTKITSPTLKSHIVLNEYNPIMVKIRQVQIKSRERERKTPASRWKDLELRIGRLLQGDLLNGFFKCGAFMEVL